jgi:hypothetical protein
VRFNFLLDRRDRFAQPLVEGVYRIHVRNLPQEALPGTCGASKVRRGSIPHKLAFSLTVLNLNPA